MRASSTNGCDAAFLNPRSAETLEQQPQKTPTFPNLSRVGFAFPLLFVPAAGLQMSTLSVIPKRRLMRETRSVL